MTIVFAATVRPQAGRSRGGLGIPGGPLAQPSTGGDELAGGQAPKPPPEHLRSGDHQGVELALGVGGGLDGGAARGQPRLERCPRSRPTR